MRDAGTDVRIPQDGFVPDSGGCSALPTFSPGTTTATRLSAPLSEESACRGCSGVRAIMGFTTNTADAADAADRRRGAFSATNIGPRHADTANRVVAGLRARETTLGPVEVMSLRGTVRQAALQL